MVFNKILGVLWKAKKFNRRHSPTSVIALLLFGKSKHFGAKILVLYGLPQFLIMTSFFIFRKAHLTHDYLTLGLTYLAANWIWLGPLFIWKYERVILPKYWLKCRHVVASRKELHAARGRLSRPVHRTTIGRVFLFCWCGLVLTAFVYSYDFMMGFAVLSKWDIWWIILVVGVGCYAYISGVGFLLVLRTSRSIWEFLNLDASIDTYNSDGCGGLSFFGKFLAQTSIMFASGAVFIPILMKLHSTLYNSEFSVVFVLVLLYSSGIALSFFIPLWLVHKKLLREKLRMMSRLASRIMHLKEATVNWTNKAYYEYRIQRDEYADLEKITTWPLNIPNVLVAFVSFILPIILAALRFLLMDFGTK